MTQNRNNEKMNFVMKNCPNLVRGGGVNILKYVPNSKMSQRSEGGGGATGQP